MSWSTTNKCCLTCAYWTGQRIARFGKWEAPSNTTYGECGCKWKTKTMATSSSDCPKYINIPAK